MKTREHWLEVIAQGVAEPEGMADVIGMIQRDAEVSALRWAADEIAKNHPGSLVECAKRLNDKAKAIAAPENKENKS